ncbi:MAG: restriction endonuclease [Alphaproteobacteria bacterium]|nr:restriction endonuclease [Alphaproteobacteria bacterium]
MATFKWESDGTGLKIRLVERRLLGGDRDVAVARWGDVADSGSMAGVGRVMSLLDEHAGDSSPAVSADGTSLFIRHDMVAGLQEHQAVGLGLPPPTSLILGVQSRGDLAQTGFTVAYRWLETSAATALGIREQGSIIWHRGIPARVPEPLFGIRTAIVRFNESDTADDEMRFRHLAGLKELIPDGPKPRHGLDVDPYVRNTKIAVASAFSLSLRTSKDGFDFDPVLFGRRMSDAWVDSDGSAVIGEAEALLSEVIQERFARHHFRMWDRCRDRYGLSSNHYVYMESGLRDALDVVRDVQRSDAETRRKFARSPQAFLKDALAGRFDEAAIERMFIPTEEYSARVLDLGLWEPIVLPWIKPVPNTWLPEAFGLMVGDTRIEMKPDEIEPARRTVDEAISKGVDTVEIGGHQVPATPATREALNHLLGLVRPNDAGPDVGADPDAAEAAAGGNEQEERQKHFLIVDQNFEATRFTRDLRPRSAFRYGVPSGLSTSLKPHQEEGLSWLEECWCAGIPGCLLADDMGLGKSLQALTFLLWLADTRRSLRLERLPVLIVAPTGLLKNWQDEHDLHLEPPGLGRPLKVYAAETKKLRAGQANGNDTRLGEPTLQTSRITEADWVLTTYDTLRDYHLSFAKLKFAAVVFDEVQKLKNPASQWAIAAKALNSDFTITMTGTPIENRSEDLWAIMDVAYPGYLPDLKAYSQTYTTDSREALGQLRAMMLDRPDDRPAVMLRRMKVDRLKGLPEKKVFPIEKAMPTRQAKTYSDAVAEGRKVSVAGDMLRTLHKLRGISLHPVDPQQARQCGHDEYIAWSARLAVTFDILRDIARKKEKALIFLESLDMQDVLAAMLKWEFGLARQPMLIHGGIPGDQRKAWVDEFQRKRDEFDVMILSPKAGGVGLTLTAANHVIHLSRWWNPAVEDQCTDRVYRIGQNRAVHVYYPMAVHPDPDIKEFSFDLKLHALLDRKRGLSREVLIPPVSPGDDEASLFRDTIGVQSRGDGEPDTLAEIDRMTARQFEEWVLRRLCAKGWRVNRTPVTGDGGADGVLSDSTGNLVIVQSKHRESTSRCDDEPINDLLRARKAYGMPTAALFAVTNAKGYSEKATERAERHEVTLIFRANILSWTES